MRVVVNQLAALGVRTGIGHYTVELLRCLREQAGRDRIEAFPSGWMRYVRETACRLRPRLEGSNKDAAPGGSTPCQGRSTFRRELMRHVRLAGRSLINSHFRAVCASAKFDLYHETNFIPLTTSCRTVATIHDLSAVLHPEWHPYDRVVWFERHFRRGLGRCEHFFAISESGRQELIRHLGLPAEKVTTTYMGIRPGLGPLPREEVVAGLRRLGLPERYLLYLGTIEPRKNILTVMRAYGQLPARVRERWPLVLVGGWGWNAGEVADYLRGTAREKGVLHLGYVAEEHLSLLYNGARALVFPSRYEGFGLPPIEMMACGGPVLASTAAALVETVGSRAHLLDPDDEDGWRRGMQRIVEDDDWHRQLTRGVQAVAAPYTWDRCAAVTLGIYRKLCGIEPALSPTPVIRRAA